MNLFGDCPHLIILKIICGHELLRVIASSELRIVPGIWLWKLRHDQVTLYAKLLDIISLCCSKQLHANVGFENPELKQTVAERDRDECRADKITR
jgi:hypothetical protein